MKFGGTSVADAESITRVVDILEHYYRSGNEVAVVVSAQRGVTDQLIANATEIVTSRDNSTIEPFIQSLRIRHMKVLGEVAGTTWTKSRKLLTTGSVTCRISKCHL